jgi:PspAA-like protein
VIVRLMNEAQFRLPEDVAGELNELDNQAVKAVEADDEAHLRELLAKMVSIVHERGERLDDADLSASDLMIPPADLTLEEARELFSGDGLIPDLPA